MGVRSPGVPDISIVMPTRERYQVLEPTLLALAAQELDEWTCELVVVDNDSEDGSRQRVEQLVGEGTLPFPARVIRERARGAAAARNAGVVAARGPVVLFMGDDCPPVVPGVVAGHASAHARERAPVAVVGHIEWDPALDMTPVMRWLDDTGKMLDYRRLEHTPPGPFLFYTGNASVTRATLLAAGGFDERFQGYGWEDYELALRMADMGLRVVYDPALRVVHSHRYELRDSLGRMHAMGRSAELLNRLHAERRPPPAPSPSGPKALAGRTLAPLALRAGAAGRMPERLARPWFKASHWAALASGYARAPLPAGQELRGGTARPQAPQRPAVSVIVPFHGPLEEGLELLSEIEGLALREDDELIVVDNTIEGVLAGHGGPVRIVPATAERSSYYARNTGAEQAGCEWMLFVDADCRLRPGLVDALLAEDPPADVGAVAGAVVAAPGQEAKVARYARSRGHLDQAAHLAHPHLPFAITANLLVRRAAWEDAGGFLESIRSSGDADFSWRLQELGWRLDYRPEAVVEHRHRETVRALVRQNLRYGAGRAWIARQHPGSFGRPRVTRRLARAGAGAGWWLVTLRFERALFNVLDAVVIVTETVGWALSNSSVRPPPRVEAGSKGTPMVLMADRFPELSETFVAGEVHALLRAGRHIRVEAAARPLRPNRSALRGLRVDYLTDDGLLRRLGAAAGLVARHPLRTGADLISRRRWRREEQPRTLRALAPRARRIARAGERHLHAHFADTAALDALRLGRLLGLPFSVTAHAYDIFRDRRNLVEKLTRAAFATTGCEYTVRALRSLAPVAEVREIVMGVDLDAFAASGPPPGGRVICAVGRLVDKKGFSVLIEAVARMDEPPSRVVIAGDGPLRGALLAQVEALGLGDVVALPGALAPAGVRELIEACDVLCAPCVIATDGDRDSAPLVVKEAMAMRRLVVASDEVGLPEFVRAPWGWLSAPGDADALAAALSEALATPDRAAAGEAGRAFVREHADVTVETRKLTALVER